ncbi:MAG TPA: hypothetical protein DIW44_13240 [Anaerolineaceae bacterium]|nr:hypothetical protein [Anaerolineaceae bacterium]
MSEIMKIQLQGSDFEIAKWIWQNLVPKQGQADSIQGEILRAIERLRTEAQENGNINWDDGYEQFVAFLQATFENENNFSAEIKESINSDLFRLKNFLPVDKLEFDSQKSMLPYVDDDLYDRLDGHLIQFCRLHPQVIPRKHNPLQYR